MRTIKTAISRRFPRVLFAFFTTLAVCVASAPEAIAVRQSAMNLFPHDTLFFVRTANAQEFGERLKDSSTGRMLADPQIKPIVDRFIGEVKAQYSEEAQEEVGLAWDELLKLPKGELAFGIVAMPAAMPAFMLLVDQGDEPTVVRSLMDRMLKAAQYDGAELTKEMIGDVEVTVVRDGTLQDRVIGVFEREGTIVAATDPNLLSHVLFHWDGTKAIPAANSEAASAAGASGDQPEFVPGPTFETNKKFLDIITQCRRPNDPPPNVIGYADPIEMVRQFGRAEPGVQIALAFLPQLGLDGIQAIGGAMTATTGQFDSLTHMHILLDNPRAGILSMLAFEAGDNKPQSWVPYDSETYITARWNFQAFYARLAAIVDGFRGEGYFNGLVGGAVSQQLGIDFKAQVVDNLAGRVTLISGFETPVRFQGRHNTLAIELVDEAGAQQTLQTIMNRDPAVFERRQFGPVTYYAIIIPGMAEMPAEQRPFNPFVAIYDKHLFAGTSINLFERIIAAGQGESERLGDSQEYARIAETLSEKTAGVKPAVLLMSRPELSWHFWYDLLMLESTRTAIDEAAADNENIERFAAILREGALPPFDVLKKYLGPGGGVIYDTNNGFHGITFSLRGE